MCLGNKERMVMGLPDNLICLHRYAHRLDKSPGQLLTASNLCSTLVTRQRENQTDLAWCECQGSIGSNSSLGPASPEASSTLPRAQDPLSVLSILFMPAYETTHCFFLQHHLQYSVYKRRFKIDFCSCCLVRDFIVIQSLLFDSSIERNLGISYECVTTCRYGVCTVSWRKCIVTVWCHIFWCLPAFVQYICILLVLSMEFSLPK